MILLDKPYISEFLLDTARKNNFPIIKTDNLVKLLTSDKLNLVHKSEVLDALKKNPQLLFYTNSENSIEWVERNLQETELPKMINLFKDKVAFRELISDNYPDYFFKAVQYHELENIDVSQFPYPFIVKPSVGFLSLGVYKVDKLNEWPEVVKSIHNEVEASKDLFPKEVYDAKKFIIEECIHGDEFAIDCYFDSDGNPVILNILKHIFGSDKDVSDRVYVTSREIIEQYKPLFEEFLEMVGNKANIKNFPCHVEVRVDENNFINPIEVNPLRFGGLCTTADLTWHAYGINSYEYYFKQIKPNWDSIFSSYPGNIFGMVLLDNSSGFEAKEIAGFDYDKVLEQFEKPLELRKFDINEYPLFGYFFFETKKDKQQELMNILKSDLREFVSLKD